MGKKELKRNLTDYINKITRLMEKHESLTSHVLLANLYLLYKIYPWQIIPQPTSKRGIIDFFYLPDKEDYNVFIEMKKFLSLSEEKTSSASKYLRIKFPKALKKIGRKDGKRLLLVTDLHSLAISVRQKEWGKTSKGNYVHIIHGISGKNCSEEIARWLKMPSGEAYRIVLWDDKVNRCEFIFDLLKKKNSHLYNKIYSSWCAVLNVGGRSWPEKFLKAYCAQSNKLEKGVPPEHMEAVRQVFSKPRINSLVKKSFTDCGVKFKQGPTKSLFS